MSEISRALANRHYDRAFTLVELRWSAPVAAAFLLESGIPVDELPIGAIRAIETARTGAA